MTKTPSSPLSDAATPLVVLEDIYKYHRTAALETAAIDGIDLTIRRGEFVAIMGPSGSGKSTLLNLIGMIDALSRGTYRFDGRDVSRLSERAVARIRKGRIGFIFQSFNLIDELTAAENIELPLTYLRVAARERRKRVTRALEELGMQHRHNHYPPQLSGGQQQRIAIARATVTEPDLILADEPTGNLDSENSRLVLQMLQNLHQRGATIAMVTHSDFDAGHAERTIELFDGKTVVAESAYLQK